MVKHAQHATHLDHHGLRRELLDREGNSPLPRSTQQQRFVSVALIRRQRSASDRTHGLSSSRVVGATQQEFLLVRASVALDEPLSWHPALRAQLNAGWLGLRPLDRFGKPVLPGELLPHPQCQRALTSMAVCCEIFSRASVVGSSQGFLDGVDAGTGVLYSRLESATAAGGLAPATPSGGVPPPEPPQTPKPQNKSLRGFAPGAVKATLRAAPGVSPTFRASLVQAG
jgi:hypothetical protein